MFLGHLISHDGIKPSPDKVEATQNYHLTSNVKQLWHYLGGMIQFYNRFYPKVAQYLAPWNEMLRRNVKSSMSLSWNEETETAFFQSKSLLADASLLVFRTANSPIQYLC